MTETNAELMQSIKTKYGSAIADVCHTSSVQPDFIAALIANESGGNIAAKRFEPGVLGHLWQVLMGRTTTYGSIAKPTLLAFIARLTSGETRMANSLPGDALNRLDDLASSWGLTQIMGYHVLEPNANASTPQAYQLPSCGLTETVRLLTEFALHFSLDVAAEFDALFRCWNTGNPDGKTFDPNYCTNGAKRQMIYNNLLAADAAAGAGS